MATDFTVFSRQYMKSTPLDCDVKVLSAHVRNIVSAEVNIPVPVPWENVRLVKAVAVITEVVDNVGAWEIDLELNAAGGTEMMSISITKNSAVGAIFEATTTTESACQGLTAAIATVDAVVIESDGSATPTGAANIFMYFEPELDTV
jgi:hypothetical protein